MLWPLPSINTNQPQACICPILSESPSISHPISSSRLSKSTGLSSLGHRENSHWLSILQMVMYMFPCFPLSSSHPLLPIPVSASLFSLSTGLQHLLTGEMSKADMACSGHTLRKNGRMGILASISAGHTPLEGARSGVSLETKIKHHQHDT